MRRAPDALLRFIMLVAAATTTTACGRSYCEAQCYCNADHSCFSGQVGFCNQRATGEELAAEELGCSKEYDALLTCQTETAVCVQLYWVVSTACEIQQGVYDKCMAAAQAQ